MKRLGELMDKLINDVVCTQAFLAWTALSALTGMAVGLFFTAVAADSAGQVVLAAAFYGAGSACIVGITGIVGYAYWYAYGGVYDRR